MKRLISGAEIRERHQWLPFEFMAVMESRELVPIDPEAGELVRRTEAVNPCLYCNGDRDAAACGEGSMIFACGEDAVYVCQRQCSNSTRMQELDAAIFFFSEVLDYEKKHGLNPYTAVTSENSPKRRIINNKVELLAACKAAEEQMTEEERQQADLKYEALIKRYGLFENPFARLKAAQEADAVRFSTMMKGVSPMPRGEEVAPPVPHFATASDLVAYYRGREVEGRKIHELHELARLVDEEFTETARLTDEALGRLLPANPGAEISDEGHKRQGHRLRRAYQQKR
jgi:hypothetical protein